MRFVDRLFLLWNEYIIYFSPAASIWFEIWGSWIRVKQISIFPGKSPKNFDFSHAISQKNVNFPGKFLKISIISGNLKKIDFPGKNWLITVTSGQIILFLSKGHHFRTYFLYMIDIIIFHDPSTTPLKCPLRPPRAPCPKSEGSDPQPPWLTPLLLPNLTQAYPLSDLYGRLTEVKFFNMLNNRPLDVVLHVIQSNKTITHIGYCHLGFNLDRVTTLIVIVELDVQFLEMYKT